MVASSADLFAITETGCNESIKDAEIIPPGYSVVRSDRMDGRKQGGALLVATPRFELRPVSAGDVTVSDQVFELICANVYFCDKCLFLCCVVYIPPNSNECDYMILFNIIEQLCVKYSQVLVIGDFNLYSCSLNIRNYLF